MYHKYNDCRIFRYLRKQIKIDAAQCIAKLQFVRNQARIRLSLSKAVIRVDTKRICNVDLYSGYSCHT